MIKKKKKKNAARGAVGVRCLAQGHLSRGIRADPGQFAALGKILPGTWCPLPPISEY